MFLLWVRLHTLMNIDSLIVLAKLCPSLPTMLKLFSVVVFQCGRVACCQLVAIYVLMCLCVPWTFHQLFWQILLCTCHCSPTYCTYTSILYNFVLYLVLNHWWYKGVLECSVAFEIYLDGTLTADFLDAFTQALHIWYNNVPLGFICWFCVAGVVCGTGGVLGSLRLDKATLVWFTKACLKVSNILFI